jgi:hypothetical protein
MKYITFLFLVLSISSCTYNVNAISKNNIEDKEDAEKITNALYESIQNEDLEKAHVYFSKRFLEVTNKDELDSIIIKTNNQLGKIIKVELMEWKTEVKKGTSPLSDYALTYKIGREKYESEELIILQKENGEIKILVYRVNSEGFIK